MHIGRKKFIQFLAFKNSFLRFILEVYESCREKKGEKRIIFQSKGKAQKEEGR